MLIRHACACIHSVCNVLYIVYMMYLKDCVHVFYEVECKLRNSSAVFAPFFLVPAPPHAMRRYFATTL